MRKNFSFGIVVLMILVACLFVSCNSEVSTTAQADDGKLVYATFDNSSKAIKPAGSSLTISYELDNIDDLYWVYTATKTDGAGTTGQTTGDRVPGNAQYKGLGGAIGPFSKGTWTFTVEGYKCLGDAPSSSPSVSDLRGSGYKLIYAGTAEGVVLNVTNDAQHAKVIDVNVYLQSTGEGSLKVKADSKFFWKNNGGSALTNLVLRVYNDSTPIYSSDIELTGHASEGDVYYSPNDDAVTGLAAGDYSLKVQIVRALGGDADQVLFEGTVSAKVYAGVTTDLDAQAIEGLFTYIEFNGTIADSIPVIVSASDEETASDNSVTFSTNYTPASGVEPSTNGTSVTVSGAGITNNDSYTLGVETSNIIAAGSKFSVSDNSTAVASIDLTLKKNDTVVSSFGDGGLAAVTTYIAKNLTSPTVYYGGDAFTKWTQSGVPTASDIDGTTVKGYYTYNSGTGALVIYTTHFSEFYVTSTDEAYNLNKNKAYATFVDSMADADSTDSVVILKDVDACYTGYSWTTKYASTYASGVTPSVEPGRAGITNPVLITCSLDLNGHTVKADNFGLVVVADGVKVSNGKIVACYQGGINKIRSYAIAISKASNVVLENLKTVGGISFGGSWSNDCTPRAICGGAGNVTVKNCDIYTGLYYAIVAQTGSSGEMIGGNIFAAEYEASSLSKYFGITNAQFVSSSGTAGEMQRKYIIVNGKAPDWGVAGQNNSITFDSVYIDLYSTKDDDYKLGSAGTDSLTYEGHIYSGTASGTTTGTTN